MAARFANLMSPLMDYTRDIFNEITPQKLASIRLIYEIIREAIVDLHSDNTELQKDAKDYFKGDLFDYHCDCVGINTRTMLYIANNPQRFIVKNNSTDSYYESH